MPVTQPISLLKAVRRGFSMKCPNCGKGHLFHRFLKVADTCEVCGEDFTAQRADDFPAYLVIVVVGHIVVPLMFMVDRMGEPPLWLMSVIFLPLTFFLALGLLRPIKGGTVGLMLRLNMLKSDADGP